VNLLDSFPSSSSKSCSATSFSNTQILSLLHAIGVEALHESWWVRGWIWRLHFSVQSRAGLLEAKSTQKQGFKASIPGGFLG
jgi:hypothetical protein